MDQNLFWEEIKVVLGTIIQEKLGKADTHGKGALITLGGLEITGINFFSMRSRECCSHTFNPLQLSRCTLTEVSKAHFESTHE